jgi:malate dehydrogenase (oxaloacetate-decarboxylating)(NADP+)
MATPASMAEMMGFDVLRDALRNKGTAFTAEERERLGLAGVLPPRVETIQEQVARVLANVRAQPSPMAKFGYLAALQDENETLFFRTLIENLEELVPIVYTPTVGQACLDWSRIYRRPRGLYVTPRERGRIAAVLRAWPQRDVGIIVVTDGGRILGLGDLGANGMGIPIGKLGLYVSCAGVDPARCLPVTLDVGTDTAAVREDPFYIGRREPRLTGPAYDELIEEFVLAAQAVFPGVLVQFEDFANVNAFRLLAAYRGRVCSFNDDIQGTGAMGLAGLHAAQRITGTRLADQRLLFFGAGEASVGMAELVAAAMEREGLSEGEARRRCWLIDSKGLVVAGRAGLAEHKRRFAHDHAPLGDLVAAVEALRPTVLVGASGQAGAFTAPVLAAMARLNERPVIFVLSNPTSKAECTAEEAYRATRGRAVLGTGSPFAPVTLAGRTHATAQANNSFIFPGLGLGVLASGASRVTDEMFFAAARALADQVTPEDLAAGRIFPPVARMREVAAAVATVVARTAYAEDFATRAQPPDIATHVRAGMYRGEYR